MRRARRSCGLTKRSAPRRFHARHAQLVPSANRSQVGLEIGHAGAALSRLLTYDDMSANLIIDPPERRRDMSSSGADPDLDDASLDMPSSGADPDLDDAGLDMPSSGADPDLDDAGLDRGPRRGRPGARRQPARCKRRPRTTRGDPARRRSAQAYAVAIEYAGVPSSLNM